jgi:hypothetical protein
MAGKVGADLAIQLSVILQAESAMEEWAVGGRFCHCGKQTCAVTAAYVAEFATKEPLL